MNKTYIYFLFLILGISFSACSDFLEEKSQDLVVPKTITEYKELILGEAYYSEDVLCPYLEVMTDDVTEILRDQGYSEDDRVDLFGYHTWQKDPEITAAGTRSYDQAWSKLYHRILFSNIVIDKVINGENGVPLEGSEEEANDLLAEAHFLKAHSYFMLINLYADPYNEATADTDLGVPINNDISIEDKVYERTTVAKIYEEINTNMNKCLEYFSKTNIEKTYFRINKHAAYLLASRIALYQHRYQDVVDYTTKVIMEKGTLYNLHEYDETYFINTSNPEILFTCGAANNGIYSYYNDAGYFFATELIDMYIDEEDEDTGIKINHDLRKTTFFQKKSRGYRIRKSGSRSIYDICFRTSEAYLNRAEALCHLENKFNEGIQDIMAIRQNRIEGEAVTVSASTKEEALELVKKERRMELCFENHRWFDLRRWGRPSISHTFTRGTTKTYTLEKNDPAYTLQIPKMVLEINNTIRKNERPDRAGK